MTQGCHCSVIEHKHLLVWLQLLGQIQLVVFMSFCLSCVTGKHQDKKGNPNVFEQYLKKQRYGKGDNGRSFREAERSIVNIVGRDFDSSKSVILIKELCRPYGVSGYVYSADIKRKLFLSNCSVC